MKTLAEVMQALYDSEINVSISCFWDGGWDVALGDSLNGYRAKVTLDSLDDAARWLTTEAKRIWPGSTFAATN